MRKNTSIFGLRFGANQHIQPLQSELEAFLKARPRQGDGKRAYDDLLNKAADYAQRPLRDAAHLAVRDYMFFGVLDQSRFVNRLLTSMVDLYHYQLSALNSIDFKKPAAFIRSAREEIARLNPHSKSDASRISRLEDMIADRTVALDKLERNWADLTTELFDITHYLMENLVRIGVLCEASIVTLIHVQIEKKKEVQLIEEIKLQFKESLRDALRNGPLTRNRLDAAKQEVAVLSQELSDLMREDVYSLTKLFEAIHDHVNSVARELNDLLKRKNDKTDNRDGLKAVFEQCARVMDQLVSDCNFDLKAAPLRSKTVHKDILAVMRKEFLDHVFGLMMVERRALADRRAGNERRLYKDPDYKGPERRVCRERRSGKQRRNR